MGVMAWAEPGMRVIREAPPQEPQGVFALGPLALLILIVMLVMAIRARRRFRGKRSGTMAALGFGISMGNALSELNCMLDPSRPQVTYVKSADEDEQPPGDGRDDDPPPPDGDDDAHAPRPGSPAATYRSTRAEP